jgi:hypothetical protein
MLNTKIGRVAVLRSMRKVNNVLGQKICSAENTWDIKAQKKLILKRNLNKEVCYGNISQPLGRETLVRVRRDISRR